MLALVLDTSSAAVTAAVVEVGPATIEPLAERTVVDGKAHGEQLSPGIRAALVDLGRPLQDLTAVVVGVGPGPFTGLRVGLVTAAALGHALNIPVYGVGSLDAIAASPAAAAAAGTLLVAGDARRREIYWGRYRAGVRFDGPNVSRPADVAAAIAVSTAIGAGARMYADVLLAGSGTYPPVTTGDADAGAARGTHGGRLLDCDYPPALGLAALAADRIRRRAPAEVPAPLYLRRPDAVAPAGAKPVRGPAERMAAPR